MVAFYEQPLEERIFASNTGFPRGSLEVCAKPFERRRVVLVADDREKCLNWRMGVVRQLIRGRDGRYRAAVVQVKSGLLRRPIRKLYKLELCAEANNLPLITSSPDNSDEDDAMPDNEVEMMDNEEEEVECEVTLPQREVGEEDRLFVHVVIRTDMDGVATCYRKLRGGACRKLIVEHLRFKEMIGFLVFCSYVFTNIPV